MALFLNCRGHSSHHAPTCREGKSSPRGGSCPDGGQGRRAQPPGGAAGTGAALRPPCASEQRRALWNQPPQRDRHVWWSGGVMVTSGSSGIRRERRPLVLRSRGRGGQLHLLERKVKVVQMCWTLRPHGLYSPGNSPGQNSGVGSLSLLQGSFPTQGWNPGLPALRADPLPAEPPGKPKNTGVGSLSLLQRIFPTQG